MTQWKASEWLALRQKTQLCDDGSDERPPRRTNMATRADCPLNKKKKRGLPRQQNRKDKKADRATSGCVSQFGYGMQYKTTRRQDKGGGACEKDSHGRIWKWVAAYTPPFLPLLLHEERRQ